VVSWYTLWNFGMLFPFWYFWTKTNLATLEDTRSRAERPHRIHKRNVNIFGDNNVLPETSGENVLRN
jgi:hypothetical protein